MPSPNLSGPLGRSHEEGCTAWDTPTLEARSSRQVKYQGFQKLLLKVAKAALFAPQFAKNKRKNVYCRYLGSCFVSAVTFLKIFLFKLCPSCF